MQNDVNALAQWCLSNGIQMNVDKTKVMIFGNPKKIEQLPPFEIKVDGLPLKVVSQYKYLGITLDNQLNYNMHVQKVIANVTNKLRQFRRMRSFLNTQAATLVYKNMILPILEYGDIFMVGTSVTNRKRLQILQNKGLRCALNKDKLTSREELHAEAELLQLKHRRNIHMLSFMYDMSKIGGNIAKPREEGVKTRSQYKKLFRIRKPKTEKFKKSLAYAGPKKWNDLPSDLHLLTTRNQFGQRLQMLLKASSQGTSFSPFFSLAKQ